MDCLYSFAKYLYLKRALSGKETHIAIFGKDCLDGGIAPLFQGLLQMVVCA